jgi:hypothetical protein
LGDVVAASANGRLYVLKGNTGYPAGEVLWKIDLPAPNRLIATPALIDIDKGKLDDIVFGTEDGALYFVHNSPGKREAEIMANLHISNAPITSSPAIGDVTGDGKLEVVSNNIINTVQTISTNVKSFKNGAVWPEYLGNNLKSGQMLGREKVTKYILFAAGGVALLLLLVSVIMSNKKLKLSKRPKVAYL